MDETLLCLLRDFEVAREVARHLDTLNAEIVKVVDDYLNELVLGKWKIVNSSIDGSFVISKEKWFVNEGDLLACFSFEVDNDEDDYDFWLNHMLGHSKYPFNIVCSLSGLLQSCDVDKSRLIGESNKLKGILLSNGFSESTSRGKKVYYFTRPIKFERQKLIEAFENENPIDGISILGDIVGELDSYVPLIDDILEKLRQ